jgi:hypothetical protein
MRFRIKDGEGQHSKLVVILMLAAIVCVLLPKLADFSHILACFFRRQISCSPGSRRDEVGWPLPVFWLGPIGALLEPQDRAP